MSYLYRADECLVGKRPKWRAKISIDVEAAAFSRILRTVFNFLFKKIVTRIVLVDDFWTFSRSRKFTDANKRMAKYHFSNLICHFFRLPFKMSHNLKRIVCISLSRRLCTLRNFLKNKFQVIFFSVIYGFKVLFVAELFIGIWKIKENVLKLINVLPASMNNCKFFL